MGSVDLASSSPTDPGGVKKEKCDWLVWCLKYAAKELMLGHHLGVYTRMCIFLYKGIMLKICHCIVTVHWCILFGWISSCCSLPEFRSQRAIKPELSMKSHAIFVAYVIGITVACLSVTIRAEDPYINHTWTITYGKIYPLGVPQQGILINGQFPGPTIEAVTNDNVIVNVINKIDEPFLITWNGIKQRKTSWQDGVLGTNCPIPANSNWTYKFQVKDQIGTFSYFPSISMHRASGAFGGFNIAQRSVISIPYPTPAGEFTLLVGDWYKLDHKELRKRLDTGLNLPPPNGILINGLPKSSTFAGERGKTYKFRVSNVGIATTLNFRIQGHILKLTEVEGTHTLPLLYESMDIHVGQSATFLVTLQATPKDYFIVASSRFLKPFRTGTGILHYSGSKTPASMPLPAEPRGQHHWSMLQARTIRMDLEANAARPNPQGSFRYGTIPVSRTLILANTEAKIAGKRRYAVNGISYVNPTTPLKLADWFNIAGVFDLNTFKDRPSTGPAVFGTSVLGTALHDFVEIIFQNNEATIQSWHLDGSSFFVVGLGSGKWTPAKRKGYNLSDAIYRHTVQVYPASWSAIMVSLDNKGMWNLRSAIWSRRYLGQELYIRVWNNEHSLYTEYDIPENALRCGKAKLA